MMTHIFCALVFLVGGNLTARHSPAVPNQSISIDSNEGKHLKLMQKIDGVGRGYATPGLSDSMIFLTGERGGLGYLQAFYLNGDKAWEVSYGPEWTTSFPGSRAAPVIDEGMIYVCSGPGNLICYNAANGIEIWKRNLPEDYQGIIPAYGYSMPVLIDEDLLIIMPGGKENNIIALNKLNGNLIWRSSGSGETPGYAPATLIHRGGRRIYAAFTEFTFFGLDADSGIVLWQHDLNFKGELPCNQPVYENGQIYIVAGPGNGARKLMLSENGSDIALLWENLELNSAFGGFVNVGDFIVGAADFKQSFVMLEKETGKINSRLRIGKGSIIRAMDAMIAYTHKGELLLLDIINDRLEILERHNILAGTGEHFSVPIFNNNIYIRHGDSLLIYKLHT